MTSHEPSGADLHVDGSGGILVAFTLVLAVGAILVWRPFFPRS